MSTPQGWHPDPTGRNQVRWWDGTQWTDWVGNNGQQSQDPLTPAAADPGTADPAAGESAGGLPTATASAGVPDQAQIEHLLSQQRLFVQYGGGTFAKAEWRTIADGNQQPVGRIWREGRTARICDLSGNPFMDVVATTRRSNLDRDMDVVGLTVTAGGHPLADVGWVTAKAVTLKFDVQGARALECRVDRTFTGVVERGYLTLGDGRVVGGLTEWGRQSSGMVLNSWLVLDKDPSLPEPLRSLAVAAPLAFDVFTHPVGRDRDMR